MRMAFRGTATATALALAWAAAVGCSSRGQSAHHASDVAASTASTPPPAASTAPGASARITQAAFNEDSDGANTTRYCFNNFTRVLRSNIASALRIKIQANHVGAKIGASSRVFDIGDATDLDLQSIHIRDFSRDTICWSLAAAKKSRRAVSGFFARIKCSPIKKP